jgi:hypothetical protein
MVYSFKAALGFAKIFLFNGSPNFIWLFPGRSPSGDLLENLFISPAGPLRVTLNEQHYLFNHKITAPVNNMFARASGISFFHPRSIS